MRDLVILQKPFLIHEEPSLIEGWHPWVTLTQPMDLSPKVHTFWYIALPCSLKTDRGRSGHSYGFFWRHKGCSWLLWWKKQDLLLLDIHVKIGLLRTVPELSNSYSMDKTNIEGITRLESPIGACLYNWRKVYLTLTLEIYLMTT